ncbi:hypothetical protein PanWU01x14_273270 [Parasponia andersonii]|uniref:Uncharacterized protein n=1 Tax=Parasponia andersonii TaxID=3476 RepID=A0A2P5B428_PARAD|nr:hypothetical protein PanWU01x14_273270 [Parasponia andersonii]
MTRKAGQIKVPLPNLWFYDQAKSKFVNHSLGITTKCFGKRITRQYATLVGIAISMIFMILCSITATKVETRKLDMVKSHVSRSYPLTRQSCGT